MLENANISVPSAIAASCKLMPPNIGVVIVEMMNTNTSTHTTMDGLPVAYTTLSVSAIPAIEPNSDQVAIQMA